MVPKKGGVTVVRNKKDELVTTRTVIGWRVCIDYRKMKSAIKKDHVPLLFIDKMLNSFAGHAFDYFLDVY